MHIYLHFLQIQNLNFIKSHIFLCPHLPKNALSLLNLHRPESRAGQKLCGSPVPLPPPHLLASAQ